MNDFLRRVRRLQERCYNKKTLVTLHYNDGTQETVDSLEAVEKIANDHNIVEVKCHDETGQSLFSAMLQAEQESGGSFDNIEELEEQ